MSSKFDCTSFGGKKNLTRMQLAQGPLGGDFEAFTPVDDSVNSNLCEPLLDCRDWYNTLAMCRNDHKILVVSIDFDDVLHVPLELLSNGENFTHHVCIMQ